MTLPYFPPGTPEHDWMIEQLTDILNGWQAARDAMTVTFPDHPHTDPGDGRTECPTCGKWVWPVTHSCKRIPVTEAARRRAEHNGGRR